MCHVIINCVGHHNDHHDDQHNDDDDRHHRHHHHHQHRGSWMVLAVPAINNVCQVTGQLQSFLLIGSNKGGGGGGGVRGI